MLAQRGLPCRARSRSLAGAWSAWERLGGTLTANVVNGVATFSKLTASLAGSYSFKATDSFSIAAATSTAIVVS